MTKQIRDEEVLARLRAAEAWHRVHAATYADLAEHLHQLMLRELAHHEVVAQAVSHRVKSLRSLQDKWVRPADDDPSVFKYDDPAHEITDIAGVRVVTYLQHLVPKVQEVIGSALATAGPENRTGLDDPSVPGYRGVHYLVELPAARLALREYQHLVGCRAEVQVQTVLQHAWAEIQHDVLYKSGTEVPPDLRRRLVALAGMLELADAEFRNVAQQLALAEEVQELESDSAGSGGPTDALQLRVLLHGHLGGADRLQALWFDHLVLVLKELGFEDATLLEEVLVRRKNQIAAVRVFLREPGYEPGPVEIVDALLRLELGDSYFQARSGWEAMQPSERQTALARHRALQVAVQGKAT